MHLACGIHCGINLTPQTDGLVEKNRDRIRPEALDMLCDSRFESVAQLFMHANPNRGNGPGRFGRSPTLLDGFHTSLLALMETMKT